MWQTMSESNDCLSCFVSEFINSRRRGAIIKLNINAPIL